jgi:nitrous oxidase accessory protein NosD
MTRSIAEVTRGGRTLILAAGALVAIAVVPAVASANTAWVNNGTPAKTPFNSCANPGFSSIGAAIGSPNTTIRVCKGTYEEQLQIERPLTVTGEAGVTVKLPASPANTTTACDVAEAQDLIAICGKGIVKVSAVTLEGRWTGGANCAKQFYGILVGGEADLLLSNSKILHAGAEPINGCQQGVGIQVGHNVNSQVGIATLSNDVIEGYQKNGVTVDGKGSKATISKDTVATTATPEIAQNGIQISRGALGKVTESKNHGKRVQLADGVR